MFLQHLFWGGIKHFGFELYHIWETDHIMVSDKVFPHQKTPDFPNHLCLRLHQLSIQSWIWSCTELITLMPKQNHPGGFILTVREWSWHYSENWLSVYFDINRHLLFWFLVFMSDGEICHWHSQTGIHNFVLKGVNAPKIWVKSLIFVHIMCTSKRQRSCSNLHSLAPAKHIKK